MWCSLCWCYVALTGRSCLELSMEATAAFTALLCVLDLLQWTSCGCGAAVSSAPIRSQHWPTQRPAQCWVVAMRAADECKQEGKQRMFGRTWWSAQIVRDSENKPTSFFYSDILSELINEPETSCLPTSSCPDSTTTYIVHVFLFLIMEEEVITFFLSSCCHSTRWPMTSSPNTFCYLLSLLIVKAKKQQL